MDDKTIVEMMILAREEAARQTLEALEAARKEIDALQNLLAIDRKLYFFYGVLVGLLLDMLLKLIF